MKLLALNEKVEVLNNKDRKKESCWGCQDLILEWNIHVWFATVYGVKHALEILELIPRKKGGGLFFEL
jgi:hypothetical protein